jgi:DNA-binding transcriptional regulator YiaG
MAIKAGSKYFPLYQYLRDQDKDHIELSFSDLEDILSRELPDSARERRGFWSNRGQGGYQAAAWLEAGYQVVAVDLAIERVEFGQKRIRYEVREEAGSLTWDAASLRALREYLGLSQAELAERLGVRQQTISEWETGQYRPTRSRSKHLRLVAERADFPFESEQSS